MLRSVTASVAARLDLSYDDIDDLRIAVDEGCAQLLEVASSAGQVTLRLSPQPDGLEITASVLGEGEWPPRALEDSLAWRVLSGLVDEVTFTREGATMEVRMVKRLPEEGRGAG